MMIRRPFFPILLGAYPSLFIFGQNRAQLHWSELWLPLGLGVLFAAAIWSIGFVLLRDATRSAFVSGSLVILCHALGLIPPTWFQAVPQSWMPHLTQIVLAVWALVVVLLVGCFLVWSRRRSTALESVTPAVNAAAMLLIGMALFGAVGGSSTGSSESQAIADAAAGARPDIHYIVLDGYGETEILREIYGHDDRPFIRALEDRGFYVARDSYANYLRTIQSLASALDMSYVRPPLGGAPEHSGDLMPLMSTLHHNSVMKLLRMHGYEIYSFETGYGATNLRRSGHFLTGKLGLSEFQNTILNLTPIPALLSLFKGPDQYELHRRRIRYTLEEIPRVASHPGPKFVFAHIMAPHPPFVFDQAGEPVANHLPFNFYDGQHFLARQPAREYLEGYANQVRFIGREILRTIDGILSSSSAPPVIVLQGDHGPGIGFSHEDYAASDVIERAFILNAYLLPAEDAREGLYPTITPVNSFRLILGHYLGEDLPLHPDRSFYNRESRPYEFVDITSRLQQEVEARRAARHPEVLD